jgi:N-acetylgalactosamine kinase
MGGGRDPVNKAMKTVSELKNGFHQVFPDSGEPKVCRAPGRINLIGEHVDYNGLPVLPMTLDRDIRIAFAPRNDGLVRLASPDDRFERADFENCSDIAPSASGSWDNYCKAAVQGLNGHIQPERFPGMDLFVAGDVPIASGLSSSSALIVSFSLAYLDVLGLQLDADFSRLELAALLAEAEHFVGTRGGGMDQTVILMGREHAACKISFSPLFAEEVPLFEDCEVVACDSLVKAEKSGEALHRYNAGPLTSRLIRALVERQAQRQFGEDVELERLADLWYGPLCLTNEEVRELFERTFPNETTTLQQVSAALGVTVEAIREEWIGDLVEPPAGFRLRARARHQLTEFARVETAWNMALAGDAVGFGEMMNGSHTSCAEDYRVSCPELDDLVAVARRAGSLGSRLTGAGFGGCTVNLVANADLDAFCEEVQQTYYTDRTDGCSDDTILVVRASDGAGYLD